MANQVTVEVDEVQEVASLHDRDPRHIRMWMRRHDLSLLEIDALLSLIEDLTESGTHSKRSREGAGLELQWVALSMSVRRMAHCYELVGRDFELLEILAEMILSCPMWEEGLPRLWVSMRHYMMLCACRWYADPEVKCDLDIIDNRLRRHSRESGE